MKIVVAPDSFKHTLSARDVARIICAEGIALLPKCEFVEFPLSDGGEGFLDTISMLFGKALTLHRCVIQDALGREIPSRFGILKQHIAVIEVAQAAGITLLKENERNPMEASSFGVGLLIDQALSMDAREFWIGVGGTTTIDGGMGLLSALGMVFKSKEGKGLRGNGRQLCKVYYCEQSSKIRQLRKLKIKVFCDSDHPLVGPDGAIEEYGPQKGANPKMIEMLQKGMINYMNVIEKATGVCLKRNLLGAGGGIAAGLHAFLGAQLMHGIDGILNLTNFKEVAASADMVITGEGKTDRQTLHGKAPTGVLKLCQKLGVPVVLLSGCIDLHEYNYDFNGFAAFISTVFIENSKYQKNYDMQLKVAARNVFSLIKLGSIFRENSCLGKGRMRTRSKANGRSKEPELFI